MDERVVASRSAENFRGAVGDHLVRIHVVRRAGAGLIHVHDELIAERAAADFIAGLDNRTCHPRIEPFERLIGLGGGALDEDSRDDEIRRSAQIADAEVFYGSGGLDAVIRVGGNVVLTERIALGSKLHDGRPATPASTYPELYCPHMLPQFFDSVLALVVKTSTDLPPDVRAAMKTAMVEEPQATQSGQALAIIAENIDLAADCEGAICQDTGMPTFEVKTPVGANQIEMRKQIVDAVAEATRRGKLRPNSVDSITGENSGTNLGPGTPIIHFEQWERDEIEVKLILKGGGCENMNAQYSLPTE